MSKVPNWRFPTPYPIDFVRRTFWGDSYKLTAENSNEINIRFLKTGLSARIVRGGLQGAEVLAVHPRSFDRGAQIEDPAHIQTLLDHKRAGRAPRATDRLYHAAPSAASFF